MSLTHGVTRSPIELPLTAKNNQVLTSSPQECRIHCYIGTHPPFYLEFYSKEKVIQVVHKSTLTLQSVKLSSDVSADAKVILDTDTDKTKNNILLEMPITKWKSEFLWCED